MHVVILARMTNTEASAERGRRHVWTMGDRLRAAREDMPGNPSQTEFARLLGVGRNSVVRYEGNAPGADKPIVILRWADVTGFDARWLEHGDDEDRGGPPINGATRREHAMPLPLAA